DKVYPGGYHAVRSLNLEVRDGEFVVLVGPSGCGKSTTLRMLAGLEEVSSGEIRIGAKRVNELEPGRRDSAMVFQNYALYPHMTVRQNLGFGLKMRGAPRAEIESRTQDVADTLGIASLLERRPRELSGGQRQRVALGRAIVRQPQVFLFDEPLSNLDAKLRVQMRAEIAALHRRLGTTMIYVTHDQVEAMTLGERIVIMEGGEVQQAEAPLEIYRRPANRFVAAFIGSPPMNFLPGAIDGRGDFAFEGRSLPLGSMARGSVVLGVRAEDLVLNGGGPTLGPVTLDVVEQMGHESMGYFQLAGLRFAMRLAADAGLAAGSRIEPCLRVGGWQLFSADDRGARLK
ncbi:MAG TPA: sn-glycerol-3-phosphate ABC transporter ATP-binding protein UgpC, partial [Lacipirellulaceae bacterium]|nr:sn-glycerol-3-phosphate ABC transporter ATP-binding protein UgpC [Lacipirellulaceae bacterium]